ncbi:MAG: hypothetical protein F4124_11790 [Acidimicrobiia bacterium]|nr:hypothetical protein [Acidimicrobiia bacterium]MYB73291.1 hypothetical protein [Acidimicrobiia bacterium]MYI00099.1 hypothetical protein [Acidimicrobiia bacterium]
MDKRAVQDAGSTEATRDIADLPEPIEGPSLSAVLNAIERELARWKWNKHLSQRPTADLGIDAASLLIEVRHARDAELE